MPRKPAAPPPAAESSSPAHNTRSRTRTTPTTTAPIQTTATRSRTAAGARPQTKIAPRTENTAGPLARTTKKQPRENADAGPSVPAQGPTVRVARAKKGVVVVPKVKGAGKAKEAAIEEESVAEASGTNGPPAKRRKLAATHNVTGGRAALGKVAAEPDADAQTRQETTNKRRRVEVGNSDSRKRGRRSIPADNEVQESSKTRRKPALSRFSHGERDPRESGSASESTRVRARSRSRSASPLTPLPAPPSPAPVSSSPGPAPVPLPPIASFSSNPSSQQSTPNPRRTSVDDSTPPTPIITYPSRAFGPRSTEGRPRTPPAPTSPAASTSTSSPAAPLSRAATEIVHFHGYPRLNDPNAIRALLEQNGIKVRDYAFDAPVTGPRLPPLPSLRAPTEVIVFESQEDPVAGMQIDDAEVPTTPPLASLSALPAPPAPPGPTQTATTPPAIMRKPGPHATPGTTATPGAGASRPRRMLTRQPTAYAYELSPAGPPAHAAAPACIPARPPTPSGASSTRHAGSERTRRKSGEQTLARSSSSTVLVQ